MNYSHLVSVERKGASYVIRIDRVFEGNRTDFCTEIELPPLDEDKRWELFEKVACNLGKFICIDSSGIRKHFNIEENEAR